MGASATMRPKPRDYCCLWHRSDPGCGLAGDNLLSRRFRFRLVRWRPLLCKWAPMGPDGPWISWSLAGFSMKPKKTRLGCSASLEMKTDGASPKVFPKWLGNTENIQTIQVTRAILSSAGLLHTQLLNSCVKVNWQRYTLGFNRWFLAVAVMI